jgi:proprotein convertase subtilisin/kexin type 5
VPTCPDGYYSSFGVCYQCNQPCASCATSANNCLSCNSSSAFPFLYNSQCFSNCPTFYYNNSINGICYSCASLAINCINCKNASSCNICDSGFVFLNGNCYANTPNGYVNISGIAQTCTSNCATCSSVPSNCMSCSNSYYLYANTCISLCPNGYIPISNICTACAPPCLTCVNSINICLSCNPSNSPFLYLSAGACVLSCPTNTYANSSTLICETCINPCSTCSSSTICLSCVNSYSLYQYNCLSSCPIGFTSINQICMICLSPCNTCTNSQTFCTSCLTSIIPSVYLSNNQCINGINCPSGTYPNNTIFQCTTCNTPCLSCTTAAICTSCIINYYLNGNVCVSSCPSKTVNINNLCVSCNSPCLTCSIS